MLEIKTKEEFNQMIANNKFVVVDFNATWCGPCKMLSPILEELEKECQDIKFLSVNVDDAVELAKEYRLMYVPTLMFFNNKEKVFQDSGFKEKEDLEGLFKEYFK